MQSFREGFDVDVVESSYHGGVSKSSLGELLGPQQLCLEAGSKDTSVRLFQNTMEGFPKHQVCVLNAQHVLRGRMEQTVPISYWHTHKQKKHMILVLREVNFCIEDRNF